MAVAMGDQQQPTSITGGDQQPSAALREAQVQNAVAFLSHPKVQASTVAAKRAFLERKGLTEAEIDEAFRRVPGSSDAHEPAASPTPPSASLPLAAPTHPAAGPAVPAYPAAQAQAQAAAPAGGSVRWTQVLLGASVVAASAWAVQHWAAPYVSSLYRRWCLPASDGRQEAAPTADQAALAAASQELRQSVEALGQVAKSLQEALEAQQAPGDVAEVLRQELQDVSSMLRTVLQTQQQRSETAEILRELEWLKASIQPESSAGRYPGGLGGPFSQPWSSQAPRAGTSNFTPGSIGREGWPLPSSSNPGPGGPDPNTSAGGPQDTMPI